MSDREELQALRRMAELEAKAAGKTYSPSGEGMPQSRKTYEKPTTAESIMGSAPIRLALGAAEPLVGAFQVGANVGDVVAEKLGLTPTVGKDVANWWKNVQEMKRKGMATPEDANPYDIAGTVGNVAMGIGGLAKSKAATTTQKALENAKIGLAFGAAQPGVESLNENATNAAIGAGIGAAVPIIGKGLSSAAQVMRGPQQSKQLVKAIESAREAGYVVPPTQANASLPNRLIEGFAGKLTTAQNASLKNQEVTNRLAAKAIGLPETAELTPKVLEDVRKTAGQAYKEVASLPVIPAQEANPLMNVAASPEINPKNMVFDLRKARNDATAWFNSYARTADPDSLAKAQAAKSAATELENQLEQYATSVGREDLVPKMVEARQLIAKTWTVGKALNPSNGNVNAKVLAKELERGKPLSDELKQIGQFAGQFKTAAQMPENMGSLPQLSPLDFATGVGLFAGTGNPLAMAGLVARPTARALALSPIMQNRLIQGPNQPLLNELGRATLYRAAPLAATNLMQK